MTLYYDGYYMSIIGANIAKKFENERTFSF